MKIKDAYERFIEMMFYERNVSILTLDCYKEDLLSFFECTKKENSEELTIYDIEDYIMKLSSQGKAATTIIRRAGTVRQFYNFLQKGRFRKACGVSPQGRRCRCTQALPSFSSVHCVCVPFCRAWTYSFFQAHADIPWSVPFPLLPFHREPTHLFRLRR